MTYEIRETKLEGSVAWEIIEDDIEVVRFFGKKHTAQDVADLLNMKLPIIAWNASLSTMPQSMLFSELYRTGYKLIQVIEGTTPIFLFMKNEDNNND